METQGQISWVFPLCYNQDVTLFASPRSDIKKLHFLMSLASARNQLDMKNEVTNEQILTAVGKMHVTIEQIQEDMTAGFARVDERFARVDEQFEELALMTKIQFDEVDRKLSILGARTRGFGLWP